MDAHDLFRRLGAGAKFDVRRFSADAARFQVGKRKYDFDSSEMLQGLDFFGNKKSVPGECGESRTNQELQDEEKKEKSLTERKEQNKKKRKRMISEITSEEEGSTIQWISSVEAKIEDKKVKRENKLTSGKLEHIRKKMIKKPLQRESISTTPKYFLEKAKDKRKKVIGQNSKKKVALENKS
uniref:DExD-box helicase 52 n=1 Tax=Molossus molossus TaxID=27622 RepID=A0A7J8CX98_MOLMO|nr:DExD-box helicase 52 [Molossus molossus]